MSTDAVELREITLRPAWAYKLGPGVHTSKYDIFPINDERLRQLGTRITASAAGSDSFNILL